MDAKTMTAVEWLVSILNKEGFAQVLTDEELEQAKAMEKEQIIDAVDGHPIQNRNLDGEQYYNETYGKA